MCGIVATIGYTKSDVNNMLETIAHRGNDSRGINEFDINNHHIVLGHNRLSINDTSDSGRQPMESDGVYLIVNGEIWNIYDNNKLLISRDWVGKLPLYIYQNGTTHTIVASELKSINSIHPTAIARIVPKNSLIEINLNNDKLEIHNNFYFNFTNTATKINTREEVGLITYNLLRNAVDKRLLSDVPIATSLSGGIDSAVITYLLSARIPTIKAYTAKFDEESRDLHFARIVAKYLNVELVEVNIPNDPNILKKRFLESIKVIEYPSTVQTEVGILQSFIAEEMCKDGIKVAFSGEGSDESYGSYGMIRMFSKKPDWSDIRKNLFEKQHYGNLLRGNTVFMNYGTIELRCPFFDTDFLNYTTNLPNEVLSHGTQWKLPLADAFTPYLPKEVINQEKRAFQKGTNFKVYIEHIILNDTTINFNNRKKMIHVIQDNFRKMNGFSHKELRNPIETYNTGVYKWIQKK